MGRRPRPIRQVQIAGDNSVQIQSGDSITNVSISASNGSVAAWNINGSVTIGRPPPPPIDWDGAAAPKRQPASFDFKFDVMAALLTATITLGLLAGSFVAGFTPLGIVGMVCNGAYAAIKARDAYKRRPRLVGVQAAELEQPVDNESHTQCAWREMRSLPTRDFSAVGDCPCCGIVAVHHMREPIQPTDPSDADVVRTCVECGQVWGEK